MTRSSSVVTPYQSPIGWSLSQLSFLRQLRPPIELKSSTSTSRSGDTGTIVGEGTSVAVGTGSGVCVAVGAGSGVAVAGGGVDVGMGTGVGVEVGTGSRMGVAVATGFTSVRSGASVRSDVVVAVATGGLGRGAGVTVGVSIPTHAKAAKAREKHIRSPRTKRRVMNVALSECSDLSADSSNSSNVAI